MHVPKPVEPRDLTAAVSRLVHRESSVREDEAAKPRLQILVIEDNGDVREGLRQLLESSGYLVEVAEDGLRGLERAIARRPRITLVDLGLPGIDGYAVAERIRRALPREEMALVALTGRTDPDDLHRVVSSGFDDYLAKPVSFAKLDALLSARLSVAPRSSVNE